MCWSWILSSVSLLKVLALGYSACWLPTAYQTTNYCPVSSLIQPTLIQPKCAALPSTIPNKNVANDDAKNLCFSDPELDAGYSEQILLQWILLMKWWILTPCKSTYLELALWHTVIIDVFAFIVPRMWTRIVLWGWTGNTSVRTEKNKNWGKKRVLRILLRGHYPGKCQYVKKQLIST